MPPGRRRWGLRRYLVLPKFQPELKSGPAALPQPAWGAGAFGCGFGMPVEPCPRPNFGQRFVLLRCGGLRADIWWGRVVGAREKSRPLFEKVTETLFLEGKGKVAFSPRRRRAEPPLPPPAAGACGVSAAARFGDASRGCEELGVSALHVELAPAPPAASAGQRTVSPLQLAFLPSG